MAKVEEVILAEEPEESAAEPTIVEELEAESVASFEELVAADDLEAVFVPLPAPWNKGVRIRPLSMEELHRMKRDATRRVRDAKGRVVGTEVDQLEVDKLTVQWSLVEPRLTAQQVDALFLRNNRLARAVLLAAQELNGLSEESAKAMQEAAEARFRR